MTENNTDSPWSFQAGDLALDFANTVDWHASGQPGELLNSYTDLVNWALDCALLSPDDAHSLTAEAERHPNAAVNALKNAIALRESIYRIFYAVAHGEQPNGEDLDALKRTWGQAVETAEIALHNDSFTWKWDRGQPDLEQMLWPVSGAAIDLLLSNRLSQVGQCADDRGCGLLFIDTSRNHSRQWCSMDSCGNRAKAQRHYQRSKRKN